MNPELFLEWLYENECVCLAFEWKADKEKSWLIHRISKIKFRIGG